MNINFVLAIPIALLFLAWHILAALYIWAVLYATVLPIVLAILPRRARDIWASSYHDRLLQLFPQLATGLLVNVIKQLLKVIVAIPAGLDLLPLSPATGRLNLSYLIRSLLLLVFPIRKQSLPLDTDEPAFSPLPVAG